MVVMLVMMVMLATMMMMVAVMAATVMITHGDHDNPFPRRHSREGVWGGGGAVLKLSVLTFDLVSSEVYLLERNTEESGLGLLAASKEKQKRLPGLLGHPPQTQMRREGDYGPRVKHWPPDDQATVDSLSNTAASKTLLTPLVK